MERLGDVLKRFGVLSKAIWPDTDNFENPVVFLVFWSLGCSWRRLGSVLEASWSVLEASWKRLEASWSRLGAVLEPS